MRYFLKTIVFSGAPLWAIQNVWLSVSYHLVGQMKPGIICRQNERTSPGVTLCHAFLCIIRDTSCSTRPTQKPAILVCCPTPVSPLWSPAIQHELSHKYIRVNPQLFSWPNSSSRHISPTTFPRPPHVNLL